MVKRYLRICADSIGMIAFLLITIMVIWQMAEKLPISLILSVPVLALLFFGMIPVLRSMRISYKKMWILLQLAGIAVMVILLKYNRTELNGDWGVLIKVAAARVLEGKYDEMPLKYLATYPNNQFWLSVLIVFFKIIKFFRPGAEILSLEQASRVFGAVMIFISLNLIYQTARKLFSEKKALIAGAVAACYLPVYLYGPLAYTDVPAMLLSAVLIYFFACSIKKEKEGKIVYWVLMGACSAIAYRVKVLVFILSIAIGITEFLRRENFRTYIKKMLLFGAAFVLVMGITGVGVRRLIPISGQLKDQKEFPPTHWIMMSISKSGGFNSQDVDFTKTFPTYEEKQEATVKEIRKRIENLGFEGMLHHIFVTKIKYTWGNGWMGGNVYPMRKPIKKTRLWECISYEGHHAKPMSVVIKIYYLCMILGTLASYCNAVRSQRKESDAQIGLLACRLALTGFFLFECIWECNGRYLFCFLPVLVPVCTEGLWVISEHTENISKRIAKILIK